jgi:hypothetical protein
MNAATLSSRVVVWAFAIVVTCSLTTQIDSAGAVQIQDLETLAELQIWFFMDENGKLRRAQTPWNRAPFLAQAELISDPEFVARTLNLSPDEDRQLNYYLQDYYRRQDESDQMHWHYPSPDIDRHQLYREWLDAAQVEFREKLPFLETAVLQTAYLRYVTVLGGLENLVYYMQILPELKLTERQRSELLPTLARVRVSSESRAKDFYQQYVAEIELILTEPQRKEFQRLYRDDVIGLPVSWDLLLAHLDLTADEPLIGALRDPQPNRWLSLPNQWYYRAAGKLTPEPWVSKHQVKQLLDSTQKTHREQSEKREIEIVAMTRLLELLQNPKISDLLEISQQQRLELTAIHTRVVQLNQRAVERFADIQNQMVQDLEIPPGQLEMADWTKVALRSQKVGQELQLEELRLVPGVLIPRQQQLLETLRVKVETRTVGLLASLRWGLLGRSLNLTQRQSQALEKLNQIQQRIVAEKLMEEETRLWTSLDHLWSAEQRELLESLQPSEKNKFRPAPGLLLLGSGSR